MTDQIDDRLEAAGKVLGTEPQVSSALSAMWEARAEDARATRRRRILLPAISIGAVLAVSGAGAVVATQWQPWELADPDIVVARDWTDVNGAYLGSCESRLVANALPAEVLSAARHYLNSVDTDKIEPRPELVAAGLRAVGRLDDVGRLVPGAVASDFDGSHSGLPWSADWFSDARILQDALTLELFDGMGKELTSRSLDIYDADLSSTMETQCTTDPARSADQ